MEFFDFVDISEKYMELVNPSSPEKIVGFGKYLRLGPGKRVVDFGCGYAAPLILWAEAYDILGIGLDIRRNACDRANAKIEERGLQDSLEVLCMKGAAFQPDERGYDAATCIGASFVFGGFRKTIQAMKEMIVKGGRLGIGEPYWLSTQVPTEYALAERGIHSERELLGIAREEGFDIEYAIRASHDDWDRYESDNWHGLIRWMEDNPDHPDRQEVIDHLHTVQDEYFKYGREYCGWAMYVLAPRCY